MRQSQAMTELDEIALNGTPTTTNYTIIAPCKVTDTDGNVLLTDNVTVSGWDAYENGQDSVTIQKSAWTNNHCYFTKSAGASSTASVALSLGNMYSTGMIIKVPILDNGESTGLEAAVDMTYPYEQGQDSVQISKGSWSGGQIQFNKSVGTASTQTVSLAAFGAWGTGNNANKCTVTVKDGNTDTGLTYVVDASGRYTAGQNSVTITEVNGTVGERWGTYWYTVTMNAKASNDATGTNTVSVNAYDAWMDGYNSAPSNPSISQCYVSSFSVSRIAKYGDGYEVVGSVNIRVDFSDGTHTTYGPYSVRTIY